MNGPSSMCPTALGLGGKAVNITLASVFEEVGQLAQTFKVVVVVLDVVNASLTVSFRNFVMKMLFPDYKY